MSPERARFLSLLRARMAQRCPGRVECSTDFDAGAITVACSACGARLALPLRKPLRPAPEPPMRESHRERVLLVIAMGAWARWRDRYVPAGERYGSRHMPVELAEVVVPSTERAA